MKQLSFSLILLLFFNSVQSQGITGDWSGNLKVSAMELPLIFHIKETDSGLAATMDSPKQGAFGLTVTQTSFEDSILRLVVQNAGITYEGTYDEANEIINGNFQQATMNLPLVLTKNKGESKSTGSPARPQEPTAPFPYQTEEVSFKNMLDNISLSGTLSLPKETGSFPAVILISGSGPQNRDSEIFGHKPFLVLSDHLTKNGIAVLRFDERGVGQSEGDFERATSEDFAKDVQAALTYLNSRDEINQNRIGLIGHSEGGMIAPMVANNTSDVSFIVLLAGQGLAGDTNLLLQKKILEQRSGFDSVSIAQSQNIFKKAYEIIGNLEGEEMLSELRNHFEKKFGDSYTEDQLNSLVHGLTTPWMRFYLNYDPAPVIDNLNIPILALFGENDFQVPPKENSEIIAQSLKNSGNQRGKILVMEDLNHLFQESETGLPGEYGQIEQTISPKVLEVVTQWIIQK